MARHKMVDGIRYTLTAKEEAARDAEEVAWAAGAFDRSIADLRRDRDNKLRATDHYGLDDVIMTEAMKTYRQDLRDLPAGLTTVEQVEAVVWPVKP